MSRRLWFVFMGLCVALVWGLPARAQSEQVTVPDLTGLNVPQAAAALNRQGLRLGTPSAQAWTIAANLIPNTIGGQNVAPGTPIERGSAIDFTILSSANVRLIYDDNDLTLINNTGTSLDLSRIVFNSTTGTQRFSASRWRGGIEFGDCTQIWSVQRGTPKSVIGCDSIFWLTTNNSAEHFWTQLSGAPAFEVLQDGVPVATCDAAPPNSQDNPLMCEFFVIGGALDPASTEYVYFSYTTDRFTVVNPSDNAWMPLEATQLQIAGLSLRLGEPTLYGATPSTVADVRKLAPQQCAMLALDPTAAATPTDPCDLIAQGTVAQPQAFWTVPFEVVPATIGGETFMCPPATPDRVTVCVMPR